MKLFKMAQVASLTALTLLAAGAAWAQEAAIRKNLAERLPAFSKIDEISKTPMNGLYEVRVNEADIFYTDAEGNFLIQGNLIDTKAKRNLTEERVDKLSAIDFNHKVPTNIEFCYKTYFINKHVCNKKWK